MNVLIIEDNQSVLDKARAEITALDHNVVACQSIAEWRRRKQMEYRSKKPDEGNYNNYDFSDFEKYPSFDEKTIDVVLTDLFLPTDGTNLGYRLTEQDKKTELPYGYIIALRYLAMGKKVVIVTNGEKGDPDHHSSPLMSVNDYLVSDPDGSLRYFAEYAQYKGPKSYFRAFTKIFEQGG